MRKRGGHRDGEEESEKKRTVISRVIAPPDMTGTRKRRHQHRLRGDETHGEAGREEERDTQRLPDCVCGD